MDYCHTYVDESGDFGSSSGSSKYIVMVAVSLGNIRSLELVPRRIRRSELGMRALHRNIQLDFHSANDVLRKHMLDEIVRSCRVQAGSIVYEKTDKRIPGPKGHSLYLEMCRQLVSQLIESERVRRTLDLTFDRMPFHYGHKHIFEEFILRAIDEKYCQLRVIPPKVILHIKSAESSPGLIAADFIAGAIHKRYSSNESVYYEIIKDIICFESVFKNKQQRCSPRTECLPQAPFRHK